LQITSNRNQENGKLKNNIPYTQPVITINITGFYFESFNRSINLKQAPPAKLTEEERKEVLNPLLQAGWTVTQGRDAIYKELMFTNFNEVVLKY